MTAHFKEAPSLSSRETRENPQVFEVSPQSARAVSPLRYMGSEFGRIRGNQAMFANLLMLSLFYIVLVVPMLWLLRPVRMVTPY